MKPEDYILAARVPESLKPQSFGPWTIRRVSTDNPNASVFSKLVFKASVGFDSQTLLHRWSMKTLHQEHGEVVMEDSRHELQKHLPIWLNARGHVLVTGLGLGCVVRGLLASKDVDQVTVVELDRQILRVVGHEFKTNRGGVRLIHGDAFKVQLSDKFDCAWHDLWTDGDRHLSLLHADLFARFRKQAKIQGAWNMPRWWKRRAPGWVLR